MHLWPLLLLTATLSGCYQSHELRLPTDAGGMDTGSDAGDPSWSELDDYCLAQTRAMCEVAVGCCTGVLAGLDRETCERNSLDDCRTYFFNPALREAIAEGRVIFDAEAGMRRVEAIRRYGPERDWALSWYSDLTIGELYSLGGTFTGTRGPAERCNVLHGAALGYPSECLMGECIEGRCSTGVGVGEACGGYRRCLDLEHPVIPDPGGYCSPRGINFRPVAPVQLYSRLLCDEGVCIPRVEDGDPCHHDRMCPIGRCEDGRCPFPQEDGEICEAHHHCGSTYCEGWSIDGPGICAPRDNPLGASCFWCTACESGACLDGRCAPAICYELRGIWLRSGI